MNIKVVACGVFEPELLHLVGETDSDITLVMLDAGLHATPDLLRLQAQEQIDAAVGHGYDGIVLGYGLCGRGTSGLLARDTPVIIPRVHDCMTLFMGSREEYRRQFSKHPGTFYTTPGWYEKKSIAEEPLRKRVRSTDDVRSDARFGELAAKYGEANAEHIIYFFESWQRNYTRAAFIDTGVGERDRYARYAKDMAEDFGWTYEELQGDISLLEDLLAGKWDDERTLVLRPGQRSVLSGDERIFDAVDVQTAGGAVCCNASASAPVKPVDRSTRAHVVLLEPEAIDDPSDDTGAGDEPETGPDHLIGLGIDAGGTYTDCVLYDLQTENVLAKSKALTTRQDLMIGINEALDRLNVDAPERIRLVALSTTLATNSIVESKGGLPGAIIMCSAVARGVDIDWQPVRVVSGQMSISGQELEVPDREEIETAIDEMLAAGVDAFAVSGYASVKNPDHELFIREIIRSRCDLPVVCGHELSSRLNFLNRANTAILNARLMPVVRELLDAVAQSLDSRGVDGTLMIVKGDGALINRQTALERPIETILSGPAASVSGAKHLTGLTDAIILDMGGTTTDAAMIDDGLVRISPDGARVGGWRTSVEAADISTVGLGGDSHLDFTSDRKLLVGPRRVIPLAYLANQHPEVREMLAAIEPSTQTERSRASALDFFVLVRGGADDNLNERERAITSALRNGPLSRGILATRAGVQAASLLRTERLEELGIVQRSALTPTDILHVTGEFCAWDRHAAAEGLRLFSELCGADPTVMIERVRAAVVERLAGQIIAAEMPGACGSDPEQWSPFLRSLFRPEQSDRLTLSLRYDRPIIAIGAPVKPFFPQVGEHLGAEVVIPRHAEVANAIGAIASEVVVRERAVVRPGEIVNYVVHTRTGRTEYDDLEAAIESAKHQTASLARERATYSGARSEQVRHAVDERRAFSAEGDEVLIEVLVETTVSGKPELKAAT